ncbi:MAG: cyclase family protein [Acutalibacteraceae bacterium]|nr:cyclase family protein [Acutalibacteraceae bacterium]
MTIYDISVEITAAPVYPGDPETHIEKIFDMDIGDSVNVSALTMSLHTGTHIEAPLHFIKNGNSISDIRLDSFMGECSVVACSGYSGVLTGADIDELVPEGARRVLFKTLGNVKLSKSAVLSLISMGVTMVGIDAQSISEADEDAQIHKHLLSAGIIILEGINLRHVQSGEYTLMALPIKLNGTEATPCRAILMK